MTPKTKERVRSHATEQANQRIRRDLLLRLSYYQTHLDEIDERLAELDEEWDIERTLEANAAMLTLSSILPGLSGRRKPLVIAAAVAGFLLQHAVQGWCPPLPLLRRMGFRTVREIETERYALKILRGDLDQVDSSSMIEPMLPKLEQPRSGGMH